MDDSEERRSMLDDLHPREQGEAVGQDVPRVQEPRSILSDINHIRDHIQTLEAAALAARQVEFDHLRAVIGHLETVAEAAKAAERDLSQELSDTSRVSVATARVVRERLAIALRALAEALELATGADVNR